MSQTKKKNLWVKGGISALILMVLVFAGSRIVPIIRGSKVRLDSLPQNTEVTNPLISLSGKTVDTRKLTINGTDVALSPTGSFKQSILLHPGYNTITIDASDTIGHQKKHTYAFLLKELDTGTFAVSSLPSQN